jgi:hypothetical protein
VLVGAAAYFLAFVPYGFYLEDEGTMLYQIARTYAGRFRTSTSTPATRPGLFYLNAWLFDVFGVNVIALRIGLAVVNAAGRGTPLRPQPAGGAGCVGARGDARLRRVPPILRR